MMIYLFRKLLHIFAFMGQAKYPLSKPLIPVGYMMRNGIDSLYTRFRIHDHLYRDQTKKQPSGRVQTKKVFDGYLVENLNFSNMTKEGVPKDWIQRLRFFEVGASQMIDNFRKRIFINQDGTTISTGVSQVDGDEWEQGEPPGEGSD